MKDNTPSVNSRFDLFDAAFLDKSLYIFFYKRLISPFKELTTPI